jgi:hypothetical protein
VTYKIAERRAQDALHRPRFRRDDMDFDLAMAQRGGCFEPDKAGADHDSTAPFSGASDQIAAVAERAQCAHMWQIAPRHLQPDGFSACGKQQFGEAEWFTAAKHDASRGGIDRRGCGAEP